MIPHIWTASRVATLQRHLRDGLSYAAIGIRMGYSRQAISGAVRRHVYKVHDDRWRPPRRVSEQTAARRPQSWSEEALTEPYAQRKARLAQERAHAAQSSR